MIFDVEKLHAALDTRRRRRGLSWAQVARDAEVYPMIFQHLGHGRTPSADSLVRLMRWLGRTNLAPFMRDAD